MNFGSDTVLSEGSKFMDLGLLSVNTMDEIGSLFVPTTRIRRLTDRFNWISPGHDISEATSDRASGTKAKNYYNFKSEFETGREKMADQDFGRQNYPISQPTLDLTPLGKNSTNRTTSPIDSIPVGTKTPDTMPLSQPTVFPEKNGKAHVPGDPNTYPSSSDASSNKPNSSNDSNYSKSKKKKRDKKKNCRKDKKYDLSDPPLSNYSDSSCDSDYRRKEHNRKSDRKRTR